MRYLRVDLLELGDVLLFRPPSSGKGLFALRRSDFGLAAIYAGGTRIFEIGAGGCRFASLRLAKVELVGLKSPKTAAVHELCDISELGDVEAFRLPNDRRPGYHEEGTLQFRRSLAAVEGITAERLRGARTQEAGAQAIPTAVATVLSALGSKGFSETDDRLSPVVCAQLVAELLWEVGYHVVAKEGQQKVRTLADLASPRCTHLARLDAILSKADAAIADDAAWRGRLEGDGYLTPSMRRAYLQSRVVKAYTEEQLRGLTKAADALRKVD